MQTLEAVDAQRDLLQIDQSFFYTSDSGSNNFIKPLSDFSLKAFLTTYHSVLKHLFNISGVTMFRLLQMDRQEVCVLQEVTVL